MKPGQVPHHIGRGFLPGVPFMEPALPHLIRQRPTGQGRSQQNRRLGFSKRERGEKTLRGRIRLAFDGDRHPFPRSRGNWKNLPGLAFIQRRKMVYRLRLPIFESQRKHGKPGATQQNVKPQELRGGGRQGHRKGNTGSIGSPGRNPIPPQPGEWRCSPKTFKSTQFSRPIDHDRLFHVKTFPLIRP